MALGLSRKVWLGLGLVLLVTAGTIALPRIYRTARLGSGFMAQTLCDGLFISGRDPQSLLGEELTGRGYELLALFQPKIDREAKRVSASAFGIGRRQAYARQHRADARVARER